MSWLTQPTSMFDGVHKTTAVEQLTLGQVLTRNQDGTYKAPIAALRALRVHDAAEYKKEKERLLAFTPGCALHTRAAKVGWKDKLIAPTQIIHLDVDGVDAPALKARVMTHPAVVFAFISPSGEGLKLGIASAGITDTTSYGRIWRATIEAWKALFPDAVFKEDEHVKFLHALCFVSYDPDLYVNDAAVPFLPPLSSSSTAPPSSSSSSPATKEGGRKEGRSLEGGRREEGEEQARVEDALTYIPADDYDTWLEIGMALHSTMEAWARPLWDTWSQRSAKYDAAMQEKKWSIFKPDGGKTIATVFYLAKEHGYLPPQPARLIVGLGTPAQQVPSCPDIILNTELTRMVDETQAALQVLPHAPVIYQRTRHLSIVARGTKPPKWLHRPQDMPVILDASAARLTELASQAAQFWKWDKRAKEYQLALPSKLIVDTLCSRTAWPFPVLEGIIASPTLRPDGSVLAVPGYDADTGLYLDTNGTTFPPLLAHPTLDDARSAIGHLQEAVTNFPFAEQWHWSATYAAILSLVCRFTIMGNVPLFAIRANTRGSGKSLLADVISIIGTGSAAPRWPQVKEDEEERKRIFTVALAGYPCLHIDNVAKPLGSPALDMALTASSFSDRLLGTNESREVPLHMVWLASGNNMQFWGDTARRIVPIDLDPKMERPEERTGFAHDPLIPWLQQERPRLTVAALTIVKAYFEADCPSQKLTPMGSFEQWSDLVRHALVWCGEKDPNEGRKDLEAESNPEYEQLAVLLEVWEKCYPIPQGKSRSKAITLKDVLDDIAGLKKMDKPLDNPPKPNTPNDYDALQDALGALDEHYDGKGLHSKCIGYKLRAMQGRMIGTKRLVTTKDRTRTTLWGLEAL